MSDDVPGGVDPDALRLACQLVQVRDDSAAALILAGGVDDVGVLRDALVLVSGVLGAIANPGADAEVLDAIVRGITLALNDALGQ